MKITDILRKTLLVSLVCLFCIAAGSREERRSLSDLLDQLIRNKHLYTLQKEQEIHNLKKLLHKKDFSPEYEYEVNLKLHSEYKKFRLDSAIHYAERNSEIARLLQDDSLRIVSDIRLACLYSYSGRFCESEEILKRVRTRKLSGEMLADYYETYCLFYEHYGSMSSPARYVEHGERYRDSLLAVLPPASFKYKINKVHNYLHLGETDQAEELLAELLETEQADTPEYALITHYLGVVYGARGDPELERKYFILSAIADIKNSIKENASFQRLALICYDNGDIAKAFTYTQSAIEDAVFSGVQFRTAQMSEFYSIINAAHQAKEAKTNSKLRVYLLLISVLALLAILLLAYIYKQVKKLSRVKEELSQMNRKLMELNAELNGKNILLYRSNTRLGESNDIKEQYIAQFFHLCSTYIDMMEVYRKTLYKLGITRQYEDLMKMLRSTTVIDNELEELYAHFDSVFLSLYPTFVSDFNSLLNEEARICLKTEDLLNKELRIYALLRLGITDSVKIAHFLRCSMSTIYNYRTKMRNKAATCREEFEEMVMKIGIPPNHLHD
ncbi:MAG: DUF6377 domain-containing protein [Bacteroides sp.]|nr:DUF6377 domain-containing protein [Bacteroides sp.]